MEVIPSIENVIPVKRYSHLFKLYRLTALVLRFIENLKHVVNNKCINTKTYCEAFEIKRARFLWIKENQKILKKQSNYTQLRQRLNIYEDSDEILRSGGRMKNALAMRF